MQVPGRRDHLVEHPVNAVADLELVLKRLEVDVAGPILDGLQEHKVQEFSHRCRIGHLFQAFEVNGLALSELVLVQVFPVLAELLKDLLDVFLGAIVSLQCPADRLFVADRSTHLAVEQEPEVIQRFQMRWVRQGYGQHAIIVADWYDPVGVRNGRRQAVDDGSRDIRAVQVNDLHAALSGQGERQVLRLDVAQLHEDAPHGAPSFLLDGQRLLDLAFGDLSHVLEDAAQKLLAVFYGRPHSVGPLVFCLKAAGQASSTGASSSLSLSLTSLG